MDMQVVRYINNKPCQGAQLPPMEVGNPGVAMVLKDLQRRLASIGKGQEGGAAGKAIH